MPTSSSRRTPQLRRPPQHMPGCSLLRRFLRVLPYPSTSFHISAPLPQFLLHNLVRTRRSAALSPAPAFFPPQLLTTPPRLPPDGRAAAPRYHPSQPPAPRRPGPSFPSFPSRPALRFARPHIPDALPPLPAFPAPTFRKAQCLQPPPGERRNSASPRLPPDGRAVRDAGRPRRQTDSPFFDPVRQAGKVSAPMFRPRLRNPFS